MTWLALAVGMVAVAEDLRRRTIPNSLTAGAMAIAVIAQAALGGWRGLGAALAGALVGFAVLLPMRPGGGDLKLMAAFGAMLGPKGILLAALLAAIFGACWAAVSLLGRPARAAIPFGPAIVLGVWAAWFGGGT
jgi:prepilin peptidase CpaA